MATEDVKRFPDALPLNEPPNVYRTLAFNGRRSPMYVMGWTFSRKDIKRFDPKHHSRDLNSFSLFVLGKNWYKSGYQERFGLSLTARVKNDHSFLIVFTVNETQKMIDQVSQEGFLDAAREVLEYPEEDPLWYIWPWKSKD